VEAARHTGPLEEEIQVSFADHAGPVSVVMNY